MIVDTHIHLYDPFRAGGTPSRGPIDGWNVRFPAASAEAKVFSENARRAYKWVERT